MAFQNWILWKEDSKPTWFLLPLCQPPAQIRNCICHLGLFLGGVRRCSRILYFLFPIITFFQIVTSLCIFKISSDSTFSWSNWLPHLEVDFLLSCIKKSIKNFHLHNNQASAGQDSPRRRRSGHPSTIGTTARTSTFFGGLIIKGWRFYVISHMIATTWKNIM